MYKFKENILNSFGLTNFQLKLLALIFMLCDHIAIKFLDKNTLYYLMRTIGRLSFPIFAFLLAEGFLKTKNRKKHAILLGVFALISEPIYDLFNKGGLDFTKFNVLFTFLSGYILLWLIELIEIDCKFFKSYMLKYAAKVAVFLVIAFITMQLNFEYNIAGILMILLFYNFHLEKSEKVKDLVNAGTVIGVNTLLFSRSIQWFGALSAVFIYLYNGKPGSTKKYKYLFYIFYPMHLLVLWGISKI